MASTFKIETDTDSDSETGDVKRHIKTFQQFVNSTSAPPKSPATPKKSSSTANNPNRRANDPLDTVL
jgi:hypothetical protein